MGKHIRSAGEALQSMVLDSPRWVHRRIQLIDSKQAGRLKLVNSLDLTPSSLTVIEGSRGMIIVPIALIPKGVLSAWWVTDGPGNPLCVVNRRQSTSLVRQMLASTLITAGVASKDELDHTDEIFDFVDNDEARIPLGPKAVWKQFPSLCDGTPKHAVVRDFINLLSTSWVVLVEIPREYIDRRIILKYGYDLMPRQRSMNISNINARFSIDIDDAGFSNSLHHEVHVAPELVISQLSLEHQVADGGKVRIFANDAHAGTISHIQNVQFIPRFGTAALEFQCQPENGGIRAFAGWALILVGVLVVLSAIMWAGPLGLFLTPFWRENSSATVLLAVPALFLSWLAKAPEAPLVALALIRLRLVNLLLALTLLSMAAALSITWSPLLWKLIWGSSYALYAAALVFWIVESKMRKPQEYKDSGTGTTGNNGVRS